MNSIPNSWIQTAIADLNEFNGKTIDPSTCASEVFELYSVPAFPSRTSELLSGGEIGSTKQTVSEGDVLVCKINPRINRVWLVGPACNRRQIASSEWIVVRAPNFDARYLRHYFSSPSFRELICDGVTGVGGSLTRAQPKRVAKFPVPVAPLSEQARIADKLDALLVRVEACRTRLDRVPALLKRFRQSVLSAAVSGQLTAEWRTGQSPQTVSLSAEALESDLNLVVPNSWCIVQAQDTVEPDASIVYGIVQPGPKLTGGVPYVQITDIVDGRIQLEDLSFTSAEIAKSYRRSSIRTGDVLLGIIRATKVAVVPDQLEGANISRSVARLRPRKGLLPQFLAIALEAPAVQNWLRAQHRGMDMPVLNLSEVRLAPIPVAPLPEQAEIVRRVESLFTLADSLEAKYQAARAQIERLTPALLAKAFRGELVPQDPNDEPADSLLARLRARTTEVEAGGANPRRRGPRSSKAPRSAFIRVPTG
jgi:type I restriction enzyme S subunit